MTTITITVILAVSLTVAAKAQYQVERFRSPAQGGHSQAFGNGARSSTTFNFGPRQVALQVNHQSSEAVFDYGGQHGAPGYRFGSAPVERSVANFGQSFRLPDSPESRNFAPSESQSAPVYSPQANFAYDSDPYTLTNPINGQKYSVNGPVWKSDEYNLNVNYKNRPQPQALPPAPQPLHNFQFHNGFLPQTDFFGHFSHPSPPVQNEYVTNNGPVFSSPPVTDLRNPFKQHFGYNFQAQQNFPGYEVHDPNQPKIPQKLVYTRPSLSDFRAQSHFNHAGLKNDRHQVNNGVQSPTETPLFESVKVVSKEEPIQNYTAVTGIDSGIGEDVITTPSTLFEPTTPIPLALPVQEEAKFKAPSTPAIVQPTTPNFQNQDQYFNNLASVPDYSALYRSQQEASTPQQPHTVPHNFNLFFQPTPEFETSSPIAPVDQRFQQQPDLYVQPTPRPLQQTEYSFFQTTPAPLTNTLQQGLLPGQITNRPSLSTSAQESEDKDQRKETLYTVNGFEEYGHEEASLKSTEVSTEQPTVANDYSETKEPEVNPFSEYTTEQPSTTSTINPLQNLYLGSTLDSLSVRNGFQFPTAFPGTNGESVSDVTEPVLPEQTSPQQILPEQTLTQRILSQQTLPQRILPQQTLPQRILPQQTLPQRVLPEQTLPQRILPEQTLLDRILPEQTLPQRILPEQTLPQRISPQQTLPQRILPQQTLQQRILPEQTLLERILPEQTLSQRILPEQALPQRILPETNLPQRISPQQTLPQRILPEQTLPQRILPQQTLPQRISSVQNLPQQILQEQSLPQQSLPEQPSSSIAVVGSLIQDTKEETTTDFRNLHNIVSSSTPSLILQELQKVVEPTVPVVSESPRDEPRTDVTSSYDREAAKRRKKVRVYKKPPVAEDSPQQQFSPRDRSSQNYKGYNGSRRRPTRPTSITTTPVPATSQRFVPRGRYHATISQRKDENNIQPSTTESTSYETRSQPKFELDFEQQTDSQPATTPRLAHRQQSHFPRFRPASGNRQLENDRISHHEENASPPRQSVRHRVRPTAPHSFSRQEITTINEEIKPTLQTLVTSDIQTTINEEPINIVQISRTESPVDLNEPLSKPEIQEFTSQRTRARLPQQGGTGESEQKDARPVFSLKKHSFNGRLRVISPTRVVNLEEQPEDKKQTRYHAKYSPQRQVVRRIKIKNNHRSESSESEDQDASGSIRTNYLRNQAFKDSLSRSQVTAPTRNALLFPPRKPLSRFGITTTTEGKPVVSTESAMTIPTDAISPEEMTMPTISTDFKDTSEHDTTQQSEFEMESTTTKVTGKRQAYDDTDLKHLIEDAQNLAHDNQNTSGEDQNAFMRPVAELSIENQSGPSKENEPTKKEMKDETSRHFPETATSLETLYHPTGLDVQPSAVPSQNPINIVTRIDIVTSISEEQSPLSKETSDVNESEYVLE